MLKEMIDIHRLGDSTWRPRAAGARAAAGLGHGADRGVPTTRTGCGGEGRGAAVPEAPRWGRLGF